MQDFFTTNFVSLIRRITMAGTALAAIIAGISNSAAAGQSEVLRNTLKNGLKVVIVRNRLAPVAIVSVDYLVGSDDAPAGFPGIAHAQEHMMFRGNSDISASQLALIGSMMGGNFNAETRESVTQYQFTVPAEDIEIALRIEASRMGHIADSDADWARERDAIEQEVGEDLSNPTYVLFTKIRAALFANSPNEHDALGTKPSFDATTSAMLKRFYDQWYAPNNAVVLIVGDVDPAGTLATVEKLFEPIPSKKLPPRPVLNFGVVKAGSIHLSSGLPFGMQGIAMRMPGAGSAESAAAEVLADALNSQRGDLFGLASQGGVLRTEFSLVSLPGASVGFINSAYPSGRDPGPIERDLRTALQRVLSEGIAPELVAEAKARERRKAEFQKNSLQGLASAWAEAVAVDGLSSPDVRLARIEKVAVADVNRVARKYLDLRYAITTTVTPQGTSKASSASGYGGQESITLDEAIPASLPDWAERALGRLSIPALNLHPAVSVLPNGMTVIVQTETNSDTVSVYGHVKTRPELEAPPGKEGVSTVLDELIAYGPQRISENAYQSALDDIGAEVHAGAEFSLSVMGENFDRGVELLAEAELRPALPVDAFEAIREQLAEVMAGKLRTASYQTQHFLRAALYPKQDPVLREAVPETIRALTIDDVRTYFHTAFRPDLTTIVVIGKIAPEQAKATVENYFGDWKADTPQPETELPSVPQNSPLVVSVPEEGRVLDREILSETLDLARANPDYYALELGNAVLGGGFYVARLSRDLRKERGLVYSVDSDVVADKSRSYYLIQYEADPKNVSEADGIVVGEFQAMLSQPVSADELVSAKALLLRQIPLKETSLRSIALGFIERQMLGLPLDEPLLAANRYLELSPEDIQSAFKKWVRPNDFVRIRQGPESAPAH